jgi:hypothetical protein
MTARQRRWKVNNRYLQLGFFNLRAVDLAEPCDGIAAAMTLYDYGVDLSGQLDPIHHPGIAPTLSAKASP